MQYIAIRYKFFVYCDISIYCDTPTSQATQKYYIPSISLEREVFSNSSDFVTLFTIPHILLHYSLFLRFCYIIHYSSDFVTLFTGELFSKWVHMDSRRQDNMITVYRQTTRFDLLRFLRQVKQYFSSIVTGQSSRFKMLTYCQLPTSWTARGLLSAVPTPTEHHDNQGILNLLASQQ